MTSRISDWLGAPSQNVLRALLVLAMSTTAVLPVAGQSSAVPIQSIAVHRTDVEVAVIAASLSDLRSESQGDRALAMALAETVTTDLAQWGASAKAVFDGDIPFLVVTALPEHADATAEHLRQAVLGHRGARALPNGFTTAEEQKDGFSAGAPREVFQAGWAEAAGWETTGSQPWAWVEIRPGVAPRDTSSAPTTPRSSSGTESDNGDHGSVTGSDNLSGDREVPRISTTEARSTDDVVTSWIGDAIFVPDATHGQRKALALALDHALESGPTRSLFEHESYAIDGPWILVWLSVEPDEEMLWEGRLTDAFRELRNTSVDPSHARRLRTKWAEQLGSAEQAALLAGRALLSGDSPEQAQDLAAGVFPTGGPAHAAQGAAALAVRRVRFVYGPN